MNRTRIRVLAWSLVVVASWSITFPPVAVGAKQKQPAQDEKLPFTDEEILAKVYDKAYKTPPGFYQDHALKDSAISLYYHQPGWFASDKDKARKLVKDFLVKPSAIKHRKIEEAKATKKFFDFRAGKIWYRVHNDNWFQPKGAKIDSGLTYQAGAAKPEVIGTLKTKPVTAETVKELAEYVWLIRFYNLAGAKVLSSQVKAADGAMVATLYTTQVVYGDFGLKDEIAVVKETYRFNEKTGAVEFSQQAVRKLTGKKNK
jgi:hypothetical protein